MTATTNAEIDAAMDDLEVMAQDHDPNKSTAKSLRKIREMLRALRDQREETIAKLADPAAVVANMMRGHIAKPDFRAFLSIYGEVFNDLEAANIANIELRDQREADAMDAGRYHACRHVALADDNDPVVIKAGQMDEANTPAEFDVQIDKIVAAMSAQVEEVPEIFHGTTAALASLSINPKE